MKHNSIQFVNHVNPSNVQRKNIFTDKFRLHRKLRKSMQYVILSKPKLLKISIC